MFGICGPRVVAAVLAVCVLCVRAEEYKSCEESIQDLEDSVQELRNLLSDVTHQVMLEGHQSRERVMAEGTTGIVKVRDYSVGSINYHFADHVGQSFANMHDHANYEKVYGLGDFMAVLNGVSFRTRHNDFELRRASTSSKDWLATEEIEAPPLPPGFDTMSIDEQMAEMKEYIRAFKMQDETIRPYKDYFKPVLCYLEGWWDANTTDVENGFESYRLKFDAKSWEDMTDKARADAFLGSDFSLKQRDGALPVTIMGIDPDTNYPVFAQWNYRILCHPLQDDVPTSYFKTVEDFPYRQQNKIKAEDMFMYKGTRYALDKITTDEARGETILDEYVGQIPGMDNLPEELQEDSVGRPKTVNLGYYNRRYVSKRDGLSSENQIRGFNDGNFFVAMTTQERVAPLLAHQCDRRPPCPLSKIRATYMFPIEILYLSPLQRWNPHKLEHFTGEYDDYDKLTSGGVYAGTHLRNYYRIPRSFFGKRLHPLNKMVADAYSGIRWMKSGVTGEKVEMSASGPRTVLPNIEGIGEVRFRYPIAPLHEEGTGVWKQLSGFADYLSDQLSAIN